MSKRHYAYRGRPLVLYWHSYRITAVKHDRPSHAVPYRLDRTARDAHGGLLVDIRQSGRVHGSSPAGTTADVSLPGVLAGAEFADCGNRIATYEGHAVMAPDGVAGRMSEPTDTRARAIEVLYQLHTEGEMLAVGAHVRSPLDIIAAALRAERQIMCEETMKMVNAWIAAHRR